MDLRKTIIIFLILQTALLLFLSVRVIALERQAILGPTIELTSAKPSPKAATYTAPISPVKSTNSLNQEDIRVIVREEMEAFTAQIVKQMDNRSRTIAKTPVPVMDPRDLSAVKATVTAQINSYSGQGIITPNEMSKLEQNIARLPPAERIKALKELNRAINKGLIEARF